MLRHIARALCLFAVLLPLSAAAQLPVPSHVNLHNGYIEVISRIQYHDDFRHPGVVRLNGGEEGELSPGGTLVLNHCCILAGSSYKVELDYMRFFGSRLLIAVTPRLCNIRGIPFGYAVVEFTGTIAKAHEGSGKPGYYFVHRHERRVDTSCPVEK